ncbi:conserved Plasmodium protein, unknown function [Babesia microti strain RI]|uniref:HIT domain-containing protein n=1 Tax=Babesia microti (strain RI) TaxID=1133968 RepID=A0A1N6LY16_BABMR|nr:conserved Plasmodium protein, unknown function [Babesia microti strain RI]SIO73768.1 conserved Plasmodium protein, unknown function [Babesia microti strain RI]|eukprot:XP_021337830.1 conserved Plasmodium protein, unknown function [Babesia microti strain RI]
MGFLTLKRLIHHSSTFGKYFNNRCYRKSCSKCGALNILKVLNCTICDSPLTDSDIRISPVDPLKILSNTKDPPNKIFSCFDYIITIYIQPIADIHLSAIPRGTFYDIMNFRPSHIQLIKSMQIKCESILKKLTDINREDAIYGFNYPNPFSHVAMHCIVPPVKNNNLLKPPYYYPLNKVLNDLEHKGRVIPYTPKEVQHLYKKKY